MQQSYIDLCRNCGVWNNTVLGDVERLIVHLELREIKPPYVIIDLVYFIEDVDYYQFDGSCKQKND